MNHGERDRAREQNRQAWNRLVEKKNRFTRPAKDEDLVDPLGTVDAIGWLGGDIRGLKLLCLAAGGGKHGAIYAQAGALVTVVDLSPAMLELDRQVASERGLDMRTVETSMDDLGMFDDGCQGRCLSQQGVDAFAAEALKVITAHHLLLEMR